MLTGLIPKGYGTIVGFITLGVLGLVHAWFPDLLSAELWTTAATVVGTFTGVRLRRAVK